MECPLLGSFKSIYGMYGKNSSYIAYCPLYGRCPLFGVSAKRGSTVIVPDRNFRQSRSALFEKLSCWVGNVEEPGFSAPNSKTQTHAFPEQK